MSHLESANNSADPYSTTALLFKGKEIDVDFEGKEDFEYGKACAILLNSLSEVTLKNLCDAAIRYCHEFESSIGENLTEFISSQAVLDHIFPTVLIVPNPPESREPIVHFEGNCTWEIEHGIEVIIRGDKLLYLGAFSGENALGDFTEKKMWNYA